MWFKLLVSAAAVCVIAATAVLLWERLPNFQNASSEEMTAEECLQAERDRSAIESGRSTALTPSPIEVGAALRLCERAGFELDRPASTFQ